MKNTTLRIAVLVAGISAAGAHAAPPGLAGCPMFPANNVWNVPVDTLPVDANSDAYVGNMLGATKKLHADWGNNPLDYFGIPFVVVPGNQAKIPVVFNAQAAAESDAGPYPIPPNPPIEGVPGADGDRHVLMLDSDNCLLYELYYVWPPNTPVFNPTPNWSAYSGAIFNLRSNQMRPDTWTSADAAGLSVLQGLVRYDEVAAGEIRHAIRMTARFTRNAYVWPASHQAGAAGAARPPMGQRFRLKSTFDTENPIYHAQTRVILRALKKYGAILADNGSDWFFSGTTDTQFHDRVFSELGALFGTNMEAVDESSLRIAANSYAAKSRMSEDFNADAKPDIIWRNAANGNAYLWYMNGPTLVSDTFLTGVDPSWKLEGVADFNGDGKTDLVWRNTATGECYVWYMNGAAFVSDARLFSLPPVWKIEAVADFNRDGKPDFLLRNTSTGLAFIWYFNDAAVVSDQYLFTIDPVWKVEAVADLNLDGQPDLLFRNMSSGLAFAWYTVTGAGGTSLGGSTPPIFGIDPVWEVVQLADWNADGKPDLLFRNASTGLVFVWYMDGTTLTTSSYVTQIDLPWETVPRR